MHLHGFESPVIMGVYKLLNTVTGNCYVGSSIDINRRFKAHMYSLRKDKGVTPALQKEYDEHGRDSFILIILEIVSERKDLRSITGKQIEQKWVKELKPTLNVTPKVRPGREYPSMKTRDNMATSRRRWHLKKRLSPNREWNAQINDYKW